MFRVRFGRILFRFGALCFRNFAHARHQTRPQAHQRVLRRAGSHSFAWPRQRNVGTQCLPRPAADLSKRMQWQFIEEYAIMRKGRSDASVDRALLDQFSLPRAFWEAKDTKDDLPTEVKKKFADGYPTTNILFWQPSRAILVQNQRQVMDADISSPETLVEVLLAFFNFELPYIQEWEDAVEEFKDKIPSLADGVLKILAEQRTTNRTFRDSFEQLLLLARSSINPDLSEASVEEMLFQHIPTRRIFRTIFNSEGFLQKNAVARELEGVIANLVQGYGTVDQFLKPLDRFYVALEKAAQSTEDYAQKQTFLNTVYEKFFQGFAVKVADTHGIVYTPQPIVDFMVRSVQGALENRLWQKSGRRRRTYLGSVRGNGQLHPARHARNPRPASAGLTPQVPARAALQRSDVAALLHCLLEHRAAFHGAYGRVPAVSGHLFGGHLRAGRRPADRHVYKRQHRACTATKERPDICGHWQSSVQRRPGERKRQQQEPHLPGHRQTRSRNVLERLASQHSLFAQRSLRKGVSVSCRQGTIEG